MADSPWKKGILVASTQETTTLCNIQTSSCIYSTVIFILHFFMQLQWYLTILVKFRLGLLIYWLRISLWFLSSFRQY